MNTPKKTLKGWQRGWQKGDNTNLAQMLGMNSSTVSRILKGKQDTTPGVREKITAYYNARKKEISRFN